MRAYRLAATAACLAAVLVPGGLAHAQQWFMVNAPTTEQAGTVVEVDLETVHAREGGGDMVVRISYDLLRPHPSGFGYRSLVATLIFDCQRRNLAHASAAYFAQPAGQGARLGAESSGRDAGLPAWLADSLPAGIRQALLKAICAG